MVMNTASVRRAPFAVRGTHKQCVKCGKLVSRDAFACRRCGKRQRIRPRTMLLVAVGLPAGRDVRGRERERAADASASARDRARVAEDGRRAARFPEGLAADVTAPELWAEYARDAGAADRQFRDKAVVGQRDRALGGAGLRRQRWSRGCRPATPSRPSTRSSRRATTRPIVGVTKGRSVSLLCVGRGALMGAPQLGGCFVR